VADSATDGGNDIVSARMQMRLMTANDVDLLLDLDADPEVMRFINGGHPSTREHVEERINASLGSRWAAFLHDASFVGWFGIRPGDKRPEDRELGYRMCREMWGRGLGTEGALAMIEHAFTRYDAARVWAQTMTVNTRSRRVMERCGLHYVRTFHGEWDDEIPGGEHGDVVYEITRAEWDAAR
jgi:RimJ/RimL family protein N-acetyltransferase